MKQTILLALLIITGTSVFAQKGVDLGLSVEWADCNLGATKCTEFGNYYFWGKEHINSDISGTSLDYAKKETGVWRMPTLKEYQELINNCRIVSTSIDNVRGKKITGKNGNSIFLPASGAYMIFSAGDKIDNGVGESVNYWLSTPASDSKNCLYNISDDMSNVLTYNRYDFYSMCIRPVRDKKPNAEYEYYADYETGRLEINIKFYDGYITYGSSKYKYNGTINGWKTYGPDGLGYYFLVDENYNVRQFIKASFYGYPDTEISMSRKDSNSSPSKSSTYNNYSGNSRRSSYNSSGTRSNKTANTNRRQQAVKHTCSRCNGKGRVRYDSFPPMYGTKDYKVKCNECGGYFLRSMGHSHISCPQCGGKGYWTSK